MKFELSLNAFVDFFQNEVRKTESWIFDNQEIGTLIKDTTPTNYIDQIEFDTWKNFVLLVKHYSKNHQAAIDNKLVEDMSEMYW